MVAAARRTGACGRGGALTLVRRAAVLGGLFTVAWALFLAAWVHGEPLSTRDFMREHARKPSDASGRLLSSTGADRGAPVPPDLRAAWPLPFVVIRSPTPTPGPSPGPLVFDLRGCTCADDWQARLGKGESSCHCGDRDCPAEVTPPFITDAEGQEVCSLLRPTGFSCTLNCHVDGKIYWYGHACGAAGQAACPALVKTASASPTASKPPRVVVAPVVTWDPFSVLDLRGANCELLDGQERCYTEDSQGRTLCPRSVTVEYLTSTDPARVPQQCLPQYAKDWYCTLQCQDGNDEVRLWPQEVARCYHRDNIGACPTRQPVVPISEWSLKPWSDQGDPMTPCRAAHAGGKAPPAGPIRGLSIGLLTHEGTAFAASLVTYEANGLFDLVDDFMVYMNGRGPALEAVLQPYIDKHPGVIRVLGTQANVGIAGGMVALTKAAKNPHFLFLERDFQLIEPATCAFEQLQAGVALLESGAAHVVRYRHRRHSGRPNWAENFFAGHEDDAFSGRQPNLACNIFYWVSDVEDRWPDRFWPCGDDPAMTCSDAFYCNWTNNPQMWSVKWWNDEYVTATKRGGFLGWKRVDAYQDLEAYMNWEPNSWNERGWTVAQGDGLFKHVDKTKF